MCWKNGFFDALFPIDERVISVPYCLKEPSKRGEYLDVLIPNRKKTNVELAFKILEKIFLIEYINIELFQSSH